MKLSVSSSSVIAGKLLLLYLLSTGFLELPLYPGWQHRIQLPELVFVLCGLFLLPPLLRGQLRYSPNLMDLGVSLYFLANILSACWNYTAGPWLEVLGKGYLVGVYFLFKLGWQNGLVDEKGMVKVLKNLLLVMLVLVGVGYIFLFFDQATNFLVRFPNYPYLGTLYRAKALLQTPSMYISVVNWCILYIWADQLHHRYQAAPFRWGFLLSAAALLSFSKGILLTGLLVLFTTLFYFRRSFFQKFFWLMALGIGLSYFLLTNFVYLRSDSLQQPGSHYIAEAERLENKGSVWLPTSYWALKKAALFMGSSTPLLGIGPGEFSKQLPAAQRAGIYPQHLLLSDPHSVYLGAWAETGALGFLGLLFLLWTAFKQIHAMNKTISLYPIFLIWLVIFLLEGMNTDLMNFRHYWVQLGLIGGLAFTK